MYYMLEQAVFTLSLWNLQRSRSWEQLTQWVSNSCVCEWVLLIPLSQTIASCFLQSDMMYSIHTDTVCGQIISSLRYVFRPPQTSDSPSTPTIPSVLECLNKFKCLSFWPKHWQSHLSKSDHFKTGLNNFSQVIIMVVSATFHCTVYYTVQKDIRWLGLISFLTSTISQQNTPMITCGFN